MNSASRTPARCHRLVAVVLLAVGATAPAAAQAGPATPTASPTSAADTVGGGSGRLAFVSTRDGVHAIYTLDLAAALAAGGTAEATRLTAGPEWSLDPAWSPDGTRLAYRQFTPGAPAPDVYVIDADGSDSRLLVRGAATPAWSPDGARIAYAAVGAEGATGIAVIDAPAALADPDAVAPTYLTRTTSTAPEEYPVWSPDGMQLCFASHRDGNWEIYVMNADGTAQRNLTRSPALEYGCAWSPDGRRIAFDSDRAGPDEGEIFLVNADGTDLVNLTNSPGGDAGPAWSPDGTKVAFTSLRDGPPYAAEIYVMDADGSHQARVTNSPDNDALPVWQP